uniref:AlNc14C123G6735 protein n=1 Tax=Albugo laibachii Nc14 TaxID=890382 RepID=F0WJL0_9STRA|nr:AlNc14C123G6735 [Albugo laibachii Nc14]|eukprot:CCA21459.1 AlNc14C123G6735 [Albugo laibachii Nc14]
MEVTDCSRQTSRFDQRCPVHALRVQRETHTLKTQENLEDEYHVPCALGDYSVNAHRTVMLRALHTTSVMSSPHKVTNVEPLNLNNIAFHQYLMPLFM